MANTLFEVTAIGWNPTKQDEVTRTVIRREQNEAEVTATDKLFDLKGENRLKELTIRPLRCTKYTLESFPESVSEEKMPEGYHMEGVLSTCKEQDLVAEKEVLYTNGPN